MWSFRSCGRGGLSRRAPLSKAKATVLLATTALLLEAPVAYAQPVVATDPALSTASSAPRVLAWAGASIFALPYLASAAVAATGYGADDGTTSSLGALWVPAVGPFIALGSASSAGGGVLLVLDGLAQIGGLTMFVYGLTSPKTIRIGDPQTHLELSIAPFVARGASGAALVATF